MIFLYTYQGLGGCRLRLRVRSNYRRYVPRPSRLSHKSLMSQTVDDMSQKGALCHKKDDLYEIIINVMVMLKSRCSDQIHVY